MSVSEAVSESRMEDVCSQIYEAATALFELQQIIELRVLFTNRRIDSGYFNDHRLLAENASHYDQDDGVKGIFWTLNPVRAECFERAPNKMRISVSGSKGERTTGDQDILERRLILIDIDPVRESGVSSTQAELDAAQNKTSAVAEFLTSKGWEAPWYGMSGNGCHLLYETQLPNDRDSGGQIKKCLEALSRRFDDDLVKVDTSVSNAARICKVYGTVARKGDNTEERPHRRSQFLGKMEV